LVKKWIGYMLIVAFAAGTQLFTEPELISQAARGLVSPTWSPNQLATWLAFRTDNFNDAAAICVDLLAIGLLCATVLVVRSGLFKTD
jgi:multiple sugar transport system permease protein